MTCCQVWCPILRICALHFTHPSAHTQHWVVNTHTRTHRTHTHTRTHARTHAQSQHRTHTRTHTHATRTHTHSTHTHTTRSSGQPFLLWQHREKLGVRCLCSRVSPQSWYLGWHMFCMLHIKSLWNMRRSRFQMIENAFISWKYTRSSEII